jgi:hypothetical protein
MFSESTCSGVSKTSYGFLVHGLLGQQVPQHDVCLVQHVPLHNGGNDRFCARLGILTIFKIAFFVYGNRN